MLDMFYLFISSHPLIFISLCLCLLACKYPCILISSYSQVHVPSFASLHPHILRLVCACLQPRILTFSYLYVHVLCYVMLIYILCACWYPDILISSYPQVHLLRVVVGILTSSQPHILSFMYSGCLLVSLHPHILVSLVSCTPGACWYPRIFTLSYLQVYVLRVLAGILASSHPYILSFMYSRCLLVSSHLHILISLGSCTPCAC